MLQISHALGFANSKSDGQKPPTCRDISWSNWVDLTTSKSAMPP